MIPCLRPAAATAAVGLPALFYSPVEGGTSMRPRVRLLGALTAILAIAALAGACGSSSSSSSSSGPPASSKPGSDIKVGLVTDIGGLNDQSFNHLAYVGLQRAAAQLGVQTKVEQSNSGLRLRAQPDRAGGSALQPGHRRRVPHGQRRQAGGEGSSRTRTSRSSTTLPTPTSAERRRAALQGAGVRLLTPATWPA